MPTTRATVVDVSEPLGDEAAALSWLAAGDEAELQEGLVTLNRALFAFRLASEDPYVRPVRRSDVLVARLGFGAGEEVAHGEWRRARELLPPPPRQRRGHVLEPQARMAAILGGRHPPLVAEELALRVRLDLDEGREREAALGLMAALDAALAELSGAGPSPAVEERLAELGSAADGVAAAAQNALAGPLTPPDRELVSEVLGRLQAALRARAATGGP